MLNHVRYSETISQHASRSHIFSGKIINRKLYEVKYKFRNQKQIWFMIMSIIFIRSIKHHYFKMIVMNAY